MKVRASVKKMCDNCKVIHRKGVVRVICTNPVNKRVESGLTYIYGIGRSRSKSILQEADINLDTHVRDLDEEQLGRIRAIIEGQGEVEGDLRKRVQMDIKRLMDIGSYRGLRHPRGPPPPPPRGPPQTPPPPG